MPKMRFRFSVAAIFVLLSFVAVALAAFNQVRQNRELSSLSKRVETIENDYRIRSRAIAFLNHLDAKSETDLELLAWSRRFTHQLGVSSLTASELNNRPMETKPKLIDLDGNAGELEVLSMANDYHVMPGWDTSINVLFDGEKVVDVATRRIYTRNGMFDKVFADTDDDGIDDLAFECFTIDFKTNGRVEGDKLLFRITKAGFQTDSN